MERLGYVVDSKGEGRVQFVGFEMVSVDGEEVERPI